MQVAAAAESAGDSDLAVSMYTAAAASEPDNVGLQLQSADGLARNGRIVEARQLLAERLRANRGQPDLMRALALVDLVADRPAQAINELDHILKGRPGDPRALVDKAIGLDLQGHHTEAQAIYRQVLAESPGDATTTNDLAVSLMLSGRTQQALETLSPMRDADGTPQKLKVNLGVLYAARGNVEQAHELLGDRVSDGELSALTQALGASAVASPTAK